jgi:hypothetical protein
MRPQVEYFCNPMNRFSYKHAKFGNVLANSITPQYDKDGIWTIYFDEAYSKIGYDARIVIVSHKFHPMLFSYRLEFEWTNKIVEYEALNLGLDLDLYMKIKFLKVIGDSNLIVFDIKRVFNTKNEKLRR